MPLDRPSFPYIPITGPAARVCAPGARGNGGAGSANSARGASAGRSKIECWIGAPSAISAVAALRVVTIPSADRTTSA